MRTLSCCPACSSVALVSVPLPIDLNSDHLTRFGDVLAPDSDFALCGRCGLLFARRRQEPAEAEAYYAAFAEIEDRSYASYPPPRAFLDAQAALATEIVGLLESADLLRPGLRVLNLRSECGALLECLRRRHGLTELYGLDHFESNLRYARDDLRLPHMSRLSPAQLELPFEAQNFDLILANHLVTHALDPRGLLADLRRLLGPAGVLVLYNEIDHLPVLRRRKRFKRGFNNFHKQLLTRQSLANLFALAGFESRLLACEPKGRRWASSGHSMVVMATRALPVEAEALPPSDTDAVLRAVRIGRLALASTRWLDAARSLVRRAPRKGRGAAWAAK